MTIAARQITTISPIDRLGALRAQIAELEANEKILVDEIKGWGKGLYEADLFSATVADVAGRETLDAKAMEAKLRELKIDGRWFSRHTKTSTASVRLTLTDR